MWVLAKGKTFRGLPLGQHGAARSSRRATIETGHVKHLANFFDIAECAKKHIEMLRH